MSAVRTVDDKASALKTRREEQKQLGKEIDKIIANGQRAQEYQSCGGPGICPSVARGLMRIFGISKRSSVATTELEAAPSDSKVHSRIFGVAVKKQSPTDKLMKAATAMRRRVDALDERAGECRASAVRLQKSGQKTAALRELKRAKALEKQSLATMCAMDAVESQNDMLEQTALQREVAAALGATAKSLKKDKNMLSKAEDAVDAASELRDLHEDMSQIMSSLGDNAAADYDDDDLAAELEEMAAEQPPPPDAPAHGATEQRRMDIAKAAEELQRRHEEFDQATSVKNALPGVPRGKVRIEKQSLLAGTQ